jgi:hypothetical protein
MRTGCPCRFKNAVASSYSAVRVLASSGDVPVRTASCPGNCIAAYRHCECVYVCVCVCVRVCTCSYITTPYTLKMQVLQSICTRFFGVVLDFSRSRTGGDVAFQLRLSPLNPDHAAANGLRALLDVYDTSIATQTIQRLNRWWKSGKRGAIPPSDLFAHPQHVVERALGDTAVAEFADEFW